MTQQTLVTPELKKTLKGEHNANADLPIVDEFTRSDANFVELYTRGGEGGLAVGATTGFAYLPSIAGTPTGTPAIVAGRVALAIDPAAGVIWTYAGGAWKSATLTAPEE
jgi:hypothetical protein